jgi:hypothetical protein
MNIETMNIETFIDNIDMSINIYNGRFADGKIVQANKLYYKLRWTG